MSVLKKGKLEQKFPISTEVGAQANKNSMNSSWLRMITLVLLTTLGLFCSDAHAVSISINDKAATEKSNNAPSAISFTVSLSGPSGQTVSVRYNTVDVTATANPAAPGVSDYTEQKDQIAVIPAGSSSTTITIPINADNLDESNKSETFNVVLSNPSNATIANGTGVGTINDDDNATLSVGTPTFDEGNGGPKGAVFPVDLSNVCDHDITFTYSLSDGTATTADPDYIGSGGTVTWPAYMASPVKIDITLVGDTIYEADETFLCDISNATGATILKSQGTGTIKNDDAPPAINIGDAKLDPEGNSGTKNLNFPVTLSFAIGLDVTVQYDTADGTASSTITPFDFTAQTGQTLKIPAGQTAAVIQVPIVGDLLNESDEKFTVKLSKPVNAAIPTTPATAGTATGTIVDDDPMPTISISDLAVTEGTGGSVNAVFTVTLSAPSGQTVKANYTFTDGTAVNFVDYTGNAGSVTFAPGQTSKTITVPITTDNVDEDDETFQVTLGTPTNATAGTLVSNATIVDDDSAGLGVADTSAIEGNSGTQVMTFNVTLATPSSKTVTVNYATADGTATSPADYSPVSGTLTFAPGETSKNVNVDIVGDTLDEGNEKLTLKLSKPVNAPFADSAGVGTIINDDQVIISIDNQTVVEGDTGATPVTFTVSLSAVSAKTITVKYTTQAVTARPLTDFTATSGTLTFAPGETSKTISVDVLGDTTDEFDETFNVKLAAPVNALLGSNIGVGTITDDDALPTITIVDATTTEGNSGTKNLNFKVALSAVSGKTISVNYDTLDFSATAGLDYTSVSGTLTFAPGATSRSVTVPILGDVLDEFDETFRVILSGNVNATVADGVGLGTIKDDDATPALTIDDITVFEGDSGTVTGILTVKLSAVSGRTVTANYSSQNSTATSGSDYSAISGKLTFAAGETSKTITVSVLGDSLDEINETFFVNLTNLVNAVSPKSQGVVTIKDDDLAPNLAINDVTVTEGNSGTVDAVFTVGLSAPSGQTITVNYATADGKAKAGSDYVATSGVLTFTPGQTSKTVTVVVKGDTIGETDETFYVNLSGVTNAIMIDNQGLGTIDEDDSVSQVMLSSALADASGSSVTLNFTGPLSVDAQDPNNYSVTVNGKPLQLQGLQVSQNSQTVILTWPARTIPNGATVVVTWNLTDTSGLDVDGTVTLTAQ